MKGLAGAAIRSLPLAVCTALMGCSGSIDSQPAAPIPAISDLRSDRDLPLRPWVPPARDVPGVDGTASTTDSIALGDAVSRAIENNPHIRAAFMEIEARHAESAQASYKPNPELSLDVENFLGSKSKSGFGAAEETLQISQTIELGDKRLKRLRAANLEASVAGWDYEVARLAVAAKAADYFIDVLASQERIEVLDDFIATAVKTKNAVEAQVTGGKAAPIDVDRAKVVLARVTAQRDLETARNLASRRSLSSLWGLSESILFKRAAGKLASARTVPDLAAVTAKINANPSIARWSDEIGKRYAMLDVERSKVIPDVKVGFGTRTFNDDGSAALVASVSVPLQVFDRNNGNTAAAERRVARSQFEEEAARRDLTSSLIEVLGTMSVAAAQIRSLEANVLPSARSAHELTRSGYNEGKFDVLHLLDTQRILLETQFEAVNARADFTKAKVRLDMLTGDGTEFAAQ